MRVFAGNLRVDEGQKNQSETRSKSNTNFYRGERVMLTRMTSIAVLMFFLACSAIYTPSNTVKRFYTYLNIGKPEKANVFYTDSAMQARDLVLKQEGITLKTWVDEQTKSGSILTIKILTERIENNRATVTCEIGFSDESSLRKTIFLQQDKDSDHWLIQSIEPLVNLDHI